MTPTFLVCGGFNMCHSAAPYVVGGELKTSTPSILVTGDDDREAAIHCCSRCNNASKQRIIDVKQCNNVLKQRIIDVKQCNNVLKQRIIDVKQCNNALKQRIIDVKQCNNDVKQCNNDVKQRIIDMKQRMTDGVKHLAVWSRKIIPRKGLKKNV